MAELMKTQNNNCSIKTIFLIKKEKEKNSVGRIWVARVLAVSACACLQSRLCRLKLLPPNPCISLIFRS